MEVARSQCVNISKSARARPFAAPWGIACRAASSTAAPVSMNAIGCATLRAAPMFLRIT